MFGLLAWLGLNLGANIKDSYDNAVAAKDSVEIDENGNRSHWDAHLNKYTNGEQIRWSGYTDKDGYWHRTEIGVKSGRVYRDHMDNSTQMMKKMDEENAQWCKDRGYAACLKYDPRFKRKVTTEFSTGKVIAAVVWLHNFYTKEDRWLKFYAKPNAKDWEYGNPDPFDPGIEITEEEYKKYKIPGATHSGILCDNVIWKHFGDKPDDWDAEAAAKKLKEEGKAIWQ